MIAMVVLWLSAVYGVSIILFYWIIKRHKYCDGEWCEVHILVYNSETCLENEVRSLVQFSRIKGQPIQLIIYDYGSTDQTKQILTTLQRRNPFLFRGVECRTEGSYSLISEKRKDVNSLMIDLRQKHIENAFEIM